MLNSLDQPMLDYCFLSCIYPIPKCLQFRFEIINPKPVISAETVEKPKKHDFQIYNYLVLLHIKFGKMPKLGFFDSLAIKHTYYVYKKTCDIVFQ